MCSACWYDGHVGSLSDSIQWWWVFSNKWSSKWSRGISISSLRLFICCFYQLKSCDVGRFCLCGCAKVDRHKIIYWWPETHMKVVWGGLYLAHLWLLLSLLCLWGHCQGCWSVPVPIVWKWMMKWMICINEWMWLEGCMMRVPHIVIGCPCRWR